MSTPNDTGTGRDRKKLSSYVRYLLRRGTSGCNETWRDLTFWTITAIIIAVAFAMAYAQVKHDRRARAVNEQRRICADACDIRRTELYPLDRPQCIDLCMWRKRSSK